MTKTAPEPLQLHDKLDDDPDGLTVADDLHYHAAKVTLLDGWRLQAHRDYQALVARVVHPDDPAEILRVAGSGLDHGRSLASDDEILTLAEGALSDAGIFLIPNRDD